MRPAIIPWALAALVILMIPVLAEGGAALTIANQMAITIVFALSYNMLLGQGGMLSFGHAVYMGLGGYFAMHLMRYVEHDAWPLPLPVLPLFAGLFGLAAAALIGLISTRRAGTSFAMISLGLGELVAACSVIVVTFFGGEAGITADRTMGPPVFGVEWFTPGEVYWIIAGWSFVAAIAMYLFTLTPAGRMANAVRDNAQRAAFLGYSPMQVRYVSFCAAGFFAGIAGGLLAINLEIMTDETLNLQTSGEILLITFLGGAGFFAGPVIGAVVFTLLKTVLGLETQLWTLYAGALFLVTVMFAPSGLAGLLVLHVAPFRLGRLGWLIWPYATVLIPGTIAVLSTCALVEMLFHMREAAVGQTTLIVLWVELDTAAPYWWAGLAVLAVVGGGLARRAAPAVKARLAEASSP